MIRFPRIREFGRILRRLFRLDRVRTSLIQHADNGSLAVQVQGDLNQVSIQAAALLPLLDPRHKRRREPTTVTELLVADIRATTLFGREAELQSLEDWLQSTQRISVRCLTGSGGSGKTRLAIELCERAEASGWHAGFISPGAIDILRDIHTRGGHLWSQPTLVVLDDAASTVATLRSWLEMLAALPPDGPSIRLLLLERTAERDLGWWLDLTRPGNISNSATIASILDPPEPSPIPALDSANDRRELLAASIHLTARILKIVPEPKLLAIGINPKLDSSIEDPAQSGGPQDLIVFGILAAKSKVSPSSAAGVAGLFRDLAHSEFERLKALAIERGLDPQLLAHIAACVTLIGGCDFDDAVRLVRQESASMEYPLTVPPKAIVDALAIALPGTSDIRVGPVVPDLVGESFVIAQVVTPLHSAEVQREIIRRSYERDPAATVRTVVRIAQNLADEQAADQGVAWIESICAFATDMAPLLQVASTMQRQSLPLQRRALAIHQILTRQLKMRAEKDPSFRSELARWMNSEVTLLLAISKFDDALERSLKVVAIRRDLLTETPTQESKAKFAWCLNNLAVCYDHCGRPHEAYATAREAVRLSAELVLEDPNSILYRSQYAMALANAANQAHSAAPTEEYEYARRALATFQQVKAQDDSRVEEHDLCLAQMSLARGLTTHNHLEEANIQFADATKRLRKLHDLAPHTHRHYFAASLCEEAISLARMARYDDALPLLDEAIQLYRSLVTINPDSYRRQLKKALETKERVLTELGRHSEAAELKAEIEALER